MILLNGKEARNMTDDVREFEEFIHLGHLLTVSPHQMEHSAHLQLNCFLSDGEYFSVDENSTDAKWLERYKMDHEEIDMVLRGMPKTGYLLTRLMALSADRTNGYDWSELDRRIAGDLVQGELFDIE